MKKGILIWCLLGVVISCFGQQEEISSLVGEHVFGTQFIYDGYGTATVIEEDGKLKIEGSQYSKDKEEYLKIDGILTEVDAKTLRFEGYLELYTKSCCGVVTHTTTFTFLKSGKRKYWRLQERDALCSPYTCAYYIDLFE